MRLAQPTRGQIIAAKWIDWSTTASEELRVTPAHRQNLSPETAVGAFRQLCECSDWLSLLPSLLSVLFFDVVILMCDVVCCEAAPWWQLSNQDTGR